VSGLKEFYIGQIESGWKQLEERIARDRNGTPTLVLDYVSNSLRMAESIDARREALAILARKIKPHRKKLDAHLHSLENELEETQTQLREISRLGKLLEKAKKPARKVARKSTKRPSPERKVQQPRERKTQPPRERRPPRIAERQQPLETRVQPQRIARHRPDEMHSYKDLQKLHSQLTPQYINKIKTNKKHEMLNGPRGNVSMTGLREWEEYFTSHRHYDELVQKLKTAGLSPTVIRKKQAPVKRFLSNIGGSGKAAIWTYARDDERKIMDMFYADARPARSKSAKISSVDQRMMSDLKITYYGLARVKNAGILRLQGNEYNREDIRALRENLSERKLVDDEAAHLCQEYRVNQKRTEEFIETVYKKLLNNLPSDLTRFSILKFGDKNVFIYNTLHSSPEKLREKLLEPLLKSFLERK